jgi:hypothetical protein
MSVVTEFILRYVPSVNVTIPLLQPHFFLYVDTTFIRVADKFSLQLQHGFQCLRRKLRLIAYVSGLKSSRPRPQMALISARFFFLSWYICHKHPCEISSHYMK